MEIEFTKVPSKDLNGKMCRMIAKQKEGTAKIRQDPRA